MSTETIQNINQQIHEKMKKRFDQIPKGLSDKFDNLTRTQTAVYRVVYLMAKQGDIFLSHQSIAERAQCCRRTVVSSMLVLRDQGYITWTSGEKYLDENGKPRQDVNHYYLTEKAFYTLPFDVLTGQMRDVEGEEKLVAMLHCNGDQKSKLIKEKGRHPVSKKRKKSTLTEKEVNGRTVKVVPMVNRSDFFLDYLSQNVDVQNCHTQDINDANNSGNQGGVKFVHSRLEELSLRNNTLDSAEAVSKNAFALGGNSMGKEKEGLGNQELINIDQEQSLDKSLESKEKLEVNNQLRDKEKLEMEKQIKNEEELETESQLKTKENLETESQFENRENTANQQNRGHGNGDTPPDSANPPKFLVPPVISSSSLVISNEKKPVEVPESNQANQATETSQALEANQQTALEPNQASESNQAVVVYQAASASESNQTAEDKADQEADKKVLVSKFENVKTRSDEVAKYIASVRVQEEKGIKKQIPIHPELKMSAVVILDVYRQAMSKKRYRDDGYFGPHQYDQIAQLIQITGSNSSACTYVEYVVNNWSNLIGSTGEKDSSKLKAFPSLNQMLAPFRIQIWNDRSQGRKNEKFLKKVQQRNKAKLKLAEKKAELEKEETRINEKASIMGRVERGEIPFDSSQFKNQITPVTPIECVNSDLEARLARMGGATTFPSKVSL